MNDAVEFLIQHGGVVLFVSVFAEQVGLPVPAIPVLLAAGALAGAGKMNLALRIARVTPDELKEMMDNGQELVIVDLRQPLGRRCC